MNGGVWRDPTALSFPWTSFKICGSDSKITMQICKNLFFTIAFYSMLPLRIPVQSEFVILIFQYSIHLLFIHFSYTSLFSGFQSKIPISYYRPNSVGIE